MSLTPKSGEAGRHYRLCRSKLWRLETLPDLELSEYHRNKQGKDKKAQGEESLQERRLALGLVAQASLTLPTKKGLLGQPGKTRPGLAASQAAAPVSQRGGTDHSVRRQQATPRPGPLLVDAAQWHPGGRGGETEPGGPESHPGRVLVHHGKGGKDRVVYISPDTHRALLEYLQVRPGLRPGRSFWWKRALTPVNLSPCGAFRNGWNTMPERPG